MSTLITDLQRPFNRSDIEFRLGGAPKQGGRAFVLAYITSRAVMERLDEVFGISGWRDEYRLLNGGIACRLAVKIDADWITKEDAAPLTNIEPLKGGFSDALKRVAVKFGIGRYLYDLPQNYVDIVPKRPLNPTNKVHFYYNNNGSSGYWEEPDLPSWALPANNKVSANDETAALPLQVALLSTLERLHSLGAITAKRAEDYQLKINSPTVGIGLLRYFKKQFELVEKIFLLNDKLPIEEKRAYYKAIFTANMKKLLEIETKLDSCQPLAA